MEPAALEGQCKAGGFAAGAAGSRRDVRGRNARHYGLWVGVENIVGWGVDQKRGEP